MTEFKDNKNDNEFDISFTKFGILTYIDKHFETELEVIDEWKPLVKLDNFNVFKKKTGSQFSSDMPYMKLEMIFEADIPMEKIIEAYFNPEHR